ncbi:hypothetical protein [Aeromonas dhakensis]|uniref:hypothetical protein n=1 Tax=Aeromonas dhakensis TaxID=196024 RepID=UPI0029DAB0B6|nr:hypothetical protein [Aeromonas dhakensis]MDX7694981.1 hypothetical protein [Aeromonas dhakensis]
MKIRLEHQNIGAAVMQIAEHQNFTAINALKIQGEPVNNGFLINGDIAVLCKYATEPNSLGEYIFSFKDDHIDDIAKVQKGKHSLFFALVCVEDGEICCLTKKEFDTLIENRKQSATVDEDQYQILVTAKKGASLRAYVNAAGKKGKTAGKMLTIPRNSFPNSIFG